jgi:hypothetical protein
MMFHRKPTIRALNFVAAGPSGDGKYFVIVACNCHKKEWALLQ